MPSCRAGSEQIQKDLFTIGGHLATFASSAALLAAAALRRLGHALDRDTLTG